LTELFAFRIKSEDLEKVSGLASEADWMRLKCTLVKDQHKQFEFRLSCLAR
jgi:hypothetical protein